MAIEELESGVLPITVKQPMPKKKSVRIKKVIEKPVDEEVVHKEMIEEKEIEEEGEIMELANPEDEVMEESTDGREANEELQ